MSDDPQQVADFNRQVEQALADEEATVSEPERLEILTYPVDRDEPTAQEVWDGEVEALVRETQTQATSSPLAPDAPLGYVTNAQNATSRSDTFLFWGPAEQDALGIGSLVCHRVQAPASDKLVSTYGVVVGTRGETIGLESDAIHVYEQDGRPPLTSILPTPSRRRPIVKFEARVLATSHPAQRPVLSGPVYAVQANELAEVHGKALPAPTTPWPDAASILLGFYQDGDGAFGAFAEERARVLGPKQGHIVTSGLPGAGKTSLFQTFVIALYAQLKRLEATAESGDNESPRVASVAFNVKGADLLFLDHQDATDLQESDKQMWQAAQVDPEERPFKRVLVYVPLADDGLNLNTLRNDPKANQADYSSTRPFALGIKDLWPYLHLFFEDRSVAAANLLAEVAQYFEGSGRPDFTLANVLQLFETDINQPQSERKQQEGKRWADIHLSVIRSVYLRLRALPTTLGGLMDVTGIGYGLDELATLTPYDLVVIDLERIMANPRDPQVAESAIKIITAYVLSRLTESMTLGKAAVDHIIVFADELNRLAPRRGEEGIGSYLSQLARTTRDRGIILFGAGQFRSGINEDILKAAAVHYSMQTPDYELDDRMYGSLSPEVKARLSRLQPGETLVQYPSLRTAVFARFPRPFVLSGGTRWREKFSPVPPLPAEQCIFERLRRLDPERPPKQDEVVAFLTALPGWNDSVRRTAQQDVVAQLRDIEMAWGRAATTQTPWEMLRQNVQTRNPDTTAPTPTPTSSSFVD